MSYRQANRTGATADVTESPTCVHVPSPQSESDEHDSAQTPAGTRAPSTYQFITHPLLGQSAAAEHGMFSGRSAHDTRKSTAKRMGFMWSMVRRFNLAVNSAHLISKAHA